MKRGQAQEGKFADSKTEYLIRTLKRTAGKGFENYVILGIWHRLRLAGLNGDIKPVTQQLVKRPGGHFALLDLYFPALNLAVECDEAYHKNNTVKDEEREKDVFKAFADCGIGSPTKGKVISCTSEEAIGAESIDVGNLVIARVDASVSYLEIDEQLDFIVNILKKRFVQMGCPVWDERKAKEMIKEKGYIDVSMQLTFGTVPEILEAFGIRRADGKAYKGWWSGSIKCPGIDNTRLYFGHLSFTAGGFTNLISEDLQTITEKRDPSKELGKINASNWRKFASDLQQGIADFYVVFAHSVNELGEKGYKFMGVYKLNGVGWKNGEKCTDDEVPVSISWKRISTRFLLKGEKMFKELAKRLKGKNVTWVPGVGPDPSVVAAVVETAADRRSESDVILITDERACDFESFRLKLGEKLEKDGGGYSSNSRDAVFTIEAVHDYGKVPDLNKDGGFAFYDVSEDQGRIIELDVSYVRDGGKREHRRVILAAVESFEFAARFLVPNSVQIHTIAFLGEGYHVGFNGIILAGTWPITVASVLGAKWAIVDHQSCVDFMKKGKGEIVRNQAWNEGGPDAPIVAYPHMRTIMERRCRLSEVKELWHEGSRASLHEICEV